MATTYEYRIEGVVTTRWYPTPHAARDVYERSRACRHLPSIHVPGDVAGDAHEMDSSAIHGIRDGHATVTLRRRARATLGERHGA